ncbi:MAG: hypothetical protein AAFR54_20335, partial [Planctomycetota bacterium]
MTLLEVILAVSLLCVVATKVVTVLNVATEQNDQDTARTQLESEVRQILRQIGFAIMGSSPESLRPNLGSSTPSSRIRYQINLGVADGEVVMTDPEEIALIEPTQEVYWTDSPDAADGRRVTWSRLVAPYLEGELPNGMDDNGNGLIDEKGLAFSIDGVNVTMHLTLERVMNDGSLLRKTYQSTVACRNLFNDTMETLIAPPS